MTDETPQKSTWMTRIEPAALLAVLFGTMIVIGNVNSLSDAGMNYQSALRFSLPALTIAVVYYSHAVTFNLPKIISLVAILVALIAWIPLLCLGSLWYSLAWTSGGMMFALQQLLFATRKK